MLAIERYFPSLTAPVALTPHRYDGVWLVAVSPVLEMRERY